ncbi:tryptophan halogenase family protein [Alteromonas oceanisediminis]|uniref:tryptophan halogenase family protein n=1 Tax=Alteromonas oceanisediminis TaxID=2836180 RepID=UPI001BDA0FD1|nr:tryptophan halogenase family protein [Alteromonas oceanisediminis]MBT0587413.1 tryptophan 7-halogenase [Alteromonas oceanisediminis]
MNNEVKKIVIVGGGTSGWLTAGLLAVEHLSHTDTGVEVCLVESPTVPPIGVGEGTWPTMRATLKRIGVRETDFFRFADASFKQGAKFARWVTGAQEDAYYHPLVLPQGYQHTNLVPYWLEQCRDIPFADAVSFQARLCELGLAPKQFTTPEYAHVANYAYHLDAGKFTTFLQQHCVEKLGVRHVLDDVVAVKSHPNNDIAAVCTKQHGDISGDLFVDCSGFKALLIGQHYQVPFNSCQDILFNDTALAVQVPYTTPDAPIASHTIATAQSNGWIWDIGLPTRKGVGYVFSSAHETLDGAERTLRNYVKDSGCTQSESLAVRKIDIIPGHRQTFWRNNCVAIGLSAGFLEPLEASALVLVELAATMLTEQLPSNRQAMDIIAKRFNQKFTYRWERIIDFLKLHYVLTKRTDTDYWIDNCRDDSTPDSLRDLLALWQYQSPYHGDFTQTDEVFPSASYQYVLYGMGYPLTTPTTQRKALSDHQNAAQLMQQNAQLTAKLTRGLPQNRELIQRICQQGLHVI